MDRILAEQKKPDPVTLTPEEIEEMESLRIKLEGEGKILPTRMKNKRFVEDHDKS